ncbi:MAG: TonB-dependent receptor [Bryobacteraceae bacterium]
MIRIASLTALTAVAALAQTAQLSGLIQDSSEARVAGVQVTLLNLDNGVRRLARSNAHGLYLIPALPPGLYRIVVRKPNFRTMVHSGVQLRTGLPARIDFVLQLGSVEEQITVRDAPWDAGDETASLGLLLSRSFVDRLPLNGRGLLTALELTPGVVITPVRTPAEPGQFSVNGQRANANLINVDGASANFGITAEAAGQDLAGSLPALSSIGSLHSLFALPAVEEFRLESSSYTAEHGLFPGGHLIVTTRAGGSTWNGSLYHLLRNEKLDANGWFNNLRRIPRAPLRWNQFGAVLGGPVRRARTFLFASYEGFRLRLPEQSLMAVPSFSARLEGSLPSRTVASWFPRPNVALPPSSPPGIGAYTLQIPNPSRHDSAGLRLDHHLGSGAQVRFHHRWSPSDAERLGRGAGISTSSIQRVEYSPRQTNASLGAALGPDAYLDIRANHSRMTSLESLDPLPGGATANLESLFANLLPPGPANLGVSVLNWSSAIEQVRGRRNTQSQWQASAALSHSPGAHQWKFGVGYRRLSTSLKDRPVSAALYFNDAASLDQGAASLLQITRRRPAAFAFHNLSLFAQDTYKASPRATWSLGIRWEFHPSPSGPPNALWPHRYANFAPRAALALRLNQSGSWILRAGGGLYYDLSAGSVLAGIARGPDYLTLALFPGASLASAQPLMLPEFGQPSPATLAQTFSYDRHLRQPVTAQWNTTAEHRFGQAATVSAGWVGAAGRRLLRSEYLDASSDPAITTGNHARSSYQSFQLQTRLRPASSLDMILNYTWAHSIDNASRDSQIFLASSRTLDRGSSDFDVRHGFTLAFLYALPATTSHVLRGWNLDGIIRARTGFPFQPNAVIVPANFVLVSPPVLFRPDLDPAQPLWVHDANLPGGRGLNPAAFPVQSTFRQGTLGRNSLAGFPFRQADLAVQRLFEVRGGSLLVVRIEAFNVTNTPNFSPPFNFGLTAPPYPPVIGWPQTTLDRDLGTGGPSRGLTPAFQVGGMRSIQLSVRLQF